MAVAWRRRRSVGLDPYVVARRLGRRVAARGIVSAVDGAAVCAYTIDRVLLVALNAMAMRDDAMRLRRRSRSVAGRSRFESISLVDSPPPLTPSRPHRPLQTDECINDEARRDTNTRMHNNHHQQQPETTTAGTLTKHQRRGCDRDPASARSTTKRANSLSIRKIGGVWIMTSIES
jgi:hypothetical protein